jgi:hypothetical protein
MKKPKPKVIIAIGVTKKKRTPGKAGKGAQRGAPSGSEYSEGSFGKGKLVDRGKKK